MNTLHSISRQGKIEQSLNHEFDLIVIGGGITGAGIALDATLRGLKTLLVEKSDFAFGTSSRSTKLIHGGLRYLKNNEFGLVQELGIERAIVHHLAPHLTVPEPMLTPIVKNGTYGKLLTSIGIWIYDFLAQVKSSEKRKMLSAKDTALQEPLIRKDILKGSALYYEYRTDDARLTIEVIKTAVSLGANCINYLKVESFGYENEDIHSIKCVDQISGKEFVFKGKYIINAAGPWVDEVRKRDGVISGKMLKATKGVHLVVAKNKLPVKQAVYFDVFDGRMIFVIPRGSITYFGTTDTFYQDSLETPDINNQDKEYLIAAVNHMFPTVDLKKEDVISGWSGLRPLIYEEQKSASEISRKDEIFVSESGLISMAGGKLTGYRKMAERAVDLISSRPSKTKNHQLIGGHFDHYDQVLTYIKKISEQINQYFPTNNLISHRLVHLYGLQTDQIMVYFLEYLKELNSEEAMLKAEMRFCFENEFIQYLDDFVVRRAGLLYFKPELIHSHLEKMSAWFSEFNPEVSPASLQESKNMILNHLKSYTTCT